MIIPVLDLYLQICIQVAIDSLMAKGPESEREQAMSLLIRIHAKKGIKSIQSSFHFHL